MTFAAAIKEAKQRRHEFFALEHILYAILHDVTGRRILFHCGADLEKLKERLEKYFEERSEKLPEGVEQDPIQTMAVQRVLQRALMHVQGAEKRKWTRATYWPPCSMKRILTQSISSSPRECRGWTC